MRSHRAGLGSRRPGHSAVTPATRLGATAAAGLLNCASPATARRDWECASERGSEGKEKSEKSSETTERERERGSQRKKESPRERERESDRESRTERVRERESEREREGGGGLI
jgi:hypothetical protein